MIGRGCPDILVGFQGLNYLFEIKSGKGILTPDEEAWIDEWEGDVVVIYNIQDAIAELLA
jgi:hypothetical protein